MVNHMDLLVTADLDCAPRCPTEGHPEAFTVVCG